MAGIVDVADQRDDSVVDFYLQVLRVDVELLDQALGHDLAQCGVDGHELGPGRGRRHGIDLGFGAGLRRELAALLASAGPDVLGG